MNSFTGLPAHPLLVHLPVVMLPLAALGVVVMLARRTWYDQYRWAVLVVAAFGTLGAILAASSGEGLEQQIRAKEGAAAVQAIHDHTQAGDLARNLAIAFFIALAAYVLVPWLLDRRAPTAEENQRRTSSRPAWIRTALMVAVALTATASMVSIVKAGHSGASRAWEDYDTSSTSAGG